jgi:endonuclease III
LTLFVTSHTIAKQSILMSLYAQGLQPPGLNWRELQRNTFVSSAGNHRMAVSSASELKRLAAKIAKLLATEYPDATCALQFSNPLQLLVATILSAQCTDVRVNMVTPALFKKYPNAAALASAKRSELEKAIQSTGFFRSKAKSVQEAAKKLVDEHGGQVPKTMEALVELPGVGRKTANVVLGTAYDIASGVVVDTHVSRLSQRLGLTKHKDPVKIERDLMALLPPGEWVDFSHRLIHHGRKVCIARKPRCEDCVLRMVCPKIGVMEKATPPRNSKPKTNSAPRRKR